MLSEGLPGKRRLEDTLTEVSGEKQAVLLAASQGGQQLELGHADVLCFVNDDEVGGRSLTAAQTFGWRCKECGWSGTPHDIFVYQTDLLLNLVETPHCPPAIRRQLDHCAWLLNLISRGDEAAIAESANAARHAVRVLHMFGDWEPWFDDTN